MTDTSFLADPSCLPALGTAERAVIDGLAVQTFSAFRVEATCGCVLYVLCFGTHPFADASALQIGQAKWAPPPGSAAGVDWPLSV